ncbi:MAG: type II secretion system F family protein, partial [Acidobacteria bacterium]|nr:type II secretion system F family protein [Acidobacteriota bacterium]
MDLTSLLLYLSVGLTFGSILVAAYYFFDRPASPVQDRLKKINPDGFVEEGPAQPIDEIIAGIAKPIVELLPPSPKNVRRLRRRLIQAGYLGENAATFYRAIAMSAFFLTPMMVTFLMVVVLGRGFDGSTVGLILVSFGFGLFLPSFTLSRWITKRQQRIARSLPDALDLMVVCVEAGLGLNAAL